MLFGLKDLVLQRIVSGGQTGVDRAAFDAAIAQGFEHGGWCPRGRLAEDGPIDERYQLTETTSPLYHVRTEKNVVDSDSTLILHRGPLTGGTALTKRLAKAHRRPLRTVDLDGDADRTAILQWLAEENIVVLNVAGPRESTSPGIYAAAHQWLAALLASAACRD